jgi:hypothetical protein
LARRRLLAEVDQLFRHPVAGEVGTFHDVEADIAQELGHRFGVNSPRDRHEIEMRLRQSGV